MLGLLGCPAAARRAGMDAREQSSQLAALRRAATECGRAVKAAWERAKRAERRADPRCWTTRRQDEALTVYVLTGGSVQAAAEYLEQRAGRGKVFDDASRRTLSEQVQEWLLARPWEELTALVEPIGPAAAARATAARRFVAERGLAAWVQEANVEKGLAPPSRQLAAVLDACARELPELPGLAAAPSAAARSVAAHRLWAHRWRKRWGVKYGKVRPRDDMTRQEMVAKARPRRATFYCAPQPNLRPFCWPHAGPSLAAPHTASSCGPQTGGPLGSPKRGLILVPKTGTRFGTQNGDPFWYPKRAPVLVPKTGASFGTQIWGRLACEH